MTTKAQALDHLTDVLAGEDVAGEPTVAGAIDKLATMIEDGEITIGGGGGEFEVINVQDDFTQGKHVLLTPIEDVIAMWRDTRPIIMVKITAIYSEATSTVFMSLSPYSSSQSTGAIGSYTKANTEYYVNMDGTITTTL